MPITFTREAPDLWREAVRTPVQIMAYLIDYHAGSVDVRTDEGRKRLIDAVMPLLRRVGDPVTRDGYLGHLALVLIALSPTIMVDILKHKEAIFPLKNPALVTMPLSFLVGILVSLIPVAFVRGALVVWAIVYLLWSMKTVYGGRWSGVLARALVILFAYSAVFVFVVGGLAIAAVMLG